MLPERGGVNRINRVLDGIQKIWQDLGSSKNTYEVVFGEMIIVMGHGYMKRYWYIYIYIYNIITVLVVTISLCEFVANQVEYNMESAQYLG